MKNRNSSIPFFIKLFINFLSSFCSLYAAKFATYLLTKPFNHKRPNREKDKVYKAIIIGVSNSVKGILYRFGKQLEIKSAVIQKLISLIEKKLNQPLSYYEGRYMISKSTIPVSYYSRQKRQRRQRSTK